MANKRVYEYAREKKLSSKELLAKAKEAGLSFKSHMSNMSEEDIKKMDRFLSPQPKEEKKESRPKVQNQNQRQNQNQNQKKASSNLNQTRSTSSNNNQESTTNSNHQERSKSNNRQRNKKNKKNKQKQNQNQLPNYNKRKVIHHDNAQKPQAKKVVPTEIEYTDGMTVSELAKKISHSPAEIISKLFAMGVMATQNASLEKDAIELVLAEYGIEGKEKVEVDPADFSVYIEEAKERDKASSTVRPPVVTIMGHVDHGKTTLLDYLRNANVVSGEAGGITQHIGAYQVDVDGRLITFLDTPGHEAFTTMRARGADVTDIVVIVVAADDGVQPQTVEAINHAKAADVPIIVAINKMDKPEANPDYIKQQMTEYELIPEEWGGDTIFVEISAKQGTNIDELLEMITLVADVQELTAAADGRALGSVIEARLDPHKGSVATILVQTGTLKHGDAIVVGNTFGRVRTMTNDKGRRIKKAGPSTPVELTGLQDVPQAGDRLVVFEDEKTARAIGEQRAMEAQEKDRQSKNKKVTLNNLFETLQEGELKTVSVVLKADVQGSVEAIAASLRKIDVEGVRVDIVHAGAGAITESDVSLASASNAFIIGFNVRPTSTAKVQAQSEEVEIRLYNIIYNVLDDVVAAMKGQLDPEYEEEITGEVSIREIYKVSNLGTIGGGYVTDGYIERDSLVRVIRNHVVVYEGQLASLRRFKDDVKRVNKGYELGLMIENYNDIKVDDVIEAYHMVEVRPK